MLNDFSFFTLARYISIGFILEVKKSFGGSFVGYFYVILLATYKQWSDVLKYECMYFMLKSKIVN